MCGDGCRRRIEDGSCQGARGGEDDRLPVYSCGGKVNRLQKSLYCRCGQEKIIEQGMCATCYTLRRQDEAYFGGLREKVLERDGYCCRVCGASGRRKRSIVVHHRVPGKSLLHLMISLCLRCHAKVGRTKLVLAELPPLLLVLWREQYPYGQEQIRLDFAVRSVVPEAVPRFQESEYS